MRFRCCFVVLLASAAAAQQKEIALGTAMAGDMRRRTTPIEDGAVRDYITSLGSRLAPQFRELNWTFTPVMDSMAGRTHEPVALPGGFVFVSASLIFAARNEAELAGMLAHAMAHVSEQHEFRTVAGEIPLVFIGGWGAFGDRERLLLPAGAAQARHTFELQADRLAVRAMSDAGYDPEALLQYIDRMQPAATDIPPERSAVPSHHERIEALKQDIQSLPPAAARAPINEEFQHIQDEVRSLIPAPPPFHPPSLYRK